MSKFIRLLSACGLSLALLLGGCGKSDEPKPEEIPKVPASSKDLSAPQRTETGKPGGVPGGPAMPPN